MMEVLSGIIETYEQLLIDYFPIPYLSFRNTSYIFLNTAETLLKVVKAIYTNFTPMKKLR